ncbi:MAG: sensor histidine kinase [Chloroflexota bacterium]
MERISDPNQTSVALGAQLFLTHFLAGLTAVILFGTFAQQTSFWIITAVSAGFLGLILNINLQISLHRLHWILIHLQNMQANILIKPNRHGPLMGIMRLMAGFVEQERPFAHQREKVLQQVSEAAAQETRHRLGRDLHDSIKQQLFNINISTAAAQNQLPTNPEKANEILADVRHSTQGALVEMKALLQQLSPAPLAKVGLVEAIKAQGEALAYRTGAEVDVQIGNLPDDEQFPMGAQEALFRIVQEALSNVARHARASRVTLALAQQGQRLSLMIKDDGQGFVSTASTGSATSASTGSAGTDSHGMGLSNIKNRLSELDGDLDIESAPNRGTIISILVPLLQTMTQKEQEMITTDHTLNRFSLVGIGGGLLLSALLFYPLYIYLPGLYVAGWEGGTAVISTVLAVLAIPLLISIGTFTAKQLPAQTRLQQAIAGGIGAYISFTIFIFLLGGSSVIVYGARSLFEHGLVEAQSETIFIYQLIEGVLGVVWGWFPAFWVGTVTSLLLGAIGGLLSSQTNSSQPQKLSEQSRFTILTSMTTLPISSLFTIVVSLAVFPLLDSQIVIASEEVMEAGFLLTYPLAGITSWPIITVFTIYFLGLATAVFFIHTTPQTLDPRQRKELLLQSYSMLLVTIVLPFFVLTILENALWLRILMGLNALAGLIFVRLIIKLERSFPPRWPQLASIGEWLLTATSFLPFILLLFNRIGLGLSLAIIGMIVGFTLNRRHGQLSAHKKTAVAQTRLAVAFGSTLPTLLAFIVPQLPILIVGFGLAATVSRAIPILSPNQTSNPLAATELVRQMYGLNIFGILSYFMLAVIIMGIVLLVLKLSAVWHEQQSQTL